MPRTKAVLPAPRSPVSATQSPGRSREASSRPSFAVPGGPGYLGIVFAFYSHRVEGQKRAYAEFGNNYVSVVELGPQIRAYSVLAYGQSADPSSPHYFDQAPLYARGELKPSWSTLEEVRQNAVTNYRPGEGGQKHHSGIVLQKANEE